MIKKYFQITSETATLNSELEKNPQLRDDKDFILNLSKKSVNLFLNILNQNTYLDKEFSFKNYDFLKEAIFFNPNLIKELHRFGYFYTEKIRKDIGIAKYVVSIDPNNLYYFSPELVSRNKDLVLLALINDDMEVNSSLYSLLGGTRLTKDREIQKLLASKDTDALSYLLQDFEEIYEDEEVLLSAIKHFEQENINAFYEAPSLIEKLSQEMILKLCEKSSYFLENFFSYIEGHNSSYKEKFDKDFFDKLNVLRYKKDIDGYRVNFPDNKNYQVLRGKFLELSQDILELQDGAKNVSGQQKNKIDNIIQSKMAELSKLRGYALVNNIMTDEEIEKLIFNAVNKDLPFISKNKKWEWQKEYGDDFQHFNRKTEEAIVLYFSKDVIEKLYHDEILRKFIFMSPQFVHFQEGGKVPVGFALVYEGKNKDGPFWVINEVQSDLINEYRNKRQEVINDVKSKKEISENELKILLQDGDRYRILPFLDDFTRKILRRNPEYIRSVPSFTNITTDADLRKIANDFSILIQNSSKIKKTVLNIEEIKYIDEKMGWLINNWQNLVFNEVWRQARENKINHIYMNTRDSVKSELSDSAKNVFYESFPRDWGFSKKPTNLRNKEENLWYRRANNWYNRMKMSERPINDYMSIGHDYDDDKNELWAWKDGKFYFHKTYQKGEHYSHDSVFNMGEQASGRIDYKNKKVSIASRLLSVDDRRVYLIMDQLIKRRPEIRYFDFYLYDFMKIVKIAAGLSYYDIGHAGHGYTDKNDIQPDIEQVWIIDKRFNFFVKDSNFYVEDDVLENDYDATHDKFWPKLIQNDNFIARGRYHKNFKEEKVSIIIERNLEERMESKEYDFLKKEVYNILKQKYPNSKIYFF